MINAHACVLPVLQNSVETEMLSPQNDRTTELNVNFLLTATVNVPALTYMYTHTLYVLTLLACTVPSGHILTKEELQVLGAMLATYSDEKLKSIQLSLQEEQEIRNISREEVEKSLRQSGLASMADTLKDNIEKGIA